MRVPKMTVERWIAIICVAVVCIASSSAQTPGPFTNGQILGATQLNSVFGSKQDYPVPSFTPSQSGSAPASGGGTTNFLRADGTWAVPPGSGGGGGGGTPGGSNGQVQFNNSGVLGGFTIGGDATLNTATGNLTVNSFGAAQSGKVGASGGGTSNFLRADGTWAVPPGTGGFSLPYINIKNYGAVGDGTCHALSSVYGSLAAAQAVYPFVSDLTQCIDWAATQQAINVAYALAPANASTEIYCPAGDYMLSNPLFIDQANGIQGNYAAWASGTTYANAANVTYNGVPWISMGSGNVGNPPTSQALFPTQIMMSFNGGGGVINQAGFPWDVATFSVASPTVVTVPSGSITISNGQAVVFFTQQFANPATGTTPALPTGINANQVYYVSNVTSTTFNISATPGGSLINVSGAGVGNFFVTPQVWQVAPVSNGTDFSNRVSFIGEEGLPSNGGCRFQTQYNWTAPVIFVSGQNGSLIKNINVVGNSPQSDGSNTYTGARCTSPLSIGGGQSSPAGPSVGTAGFALMSNGGGSRTKFENSGATRVSIPFWVGYGTNGQLTDSNTWEKPNFTESCIGIYFGQTQAFINSIYDAVSNDNDTGLVAYTQNGAKVIGGNWSSGVANSTSFAVTSVSSAAGCGFRCVTATITTPDNYLQTPMCAYAAGQTFNAGANYTNAWPFGFGCGYNIFIMNVPHWGLVGMNVMNYNPVSKQIVLGIPTSYAGIYQSTCCGSDLATQIATVTKLYATEGTIGFFGNSQVDTIHVENDGTPTTLSCFCTKFFSGGRPAELRNVTLNAEASVGSVGCCNHQATLSDFWIAKWAGQQVAPFLNAQLGDMVVDTLNGGFNGLGAPTSFYHGNMDRALIATETSTYIEGRHMVGSNDQNVSTGSGGNNAAPLFDFLNTAIGNSFLSTPPLINPGTLGQISGGYYAMGGSALGSGLWDNGANFVPSSAFSVNASNQPVDQASMWRGRGWGQTPQWGVRPAPWTNACILPSQATALGSVPAITHTSRLQDFLNVSAGGTGYAVNDTITLAGGTATTRAVVTVTAVSGSAVTAVQVQTPGTYTAEATTFTQFSTSGGGSGATFNLPIWYVDYTIGYPLLWGGAIYHVCDYTGSAFPASNVAWVSKNIGYSYYSALTTTNVPNLAWTMDGASPFIYMNLEALELMFPGLVIGLVSDGTGGCTAVAQQNFMVQEVHPSAGYVKVVRVDNDGSNYVPSLAASGTTCKNNTIAQQAVNIAHPY